MFTSQEIDILFQALDAWEKEEVGSAMMGAVLGAALLGKEYEKEAKQDVNDAVAESKLRQRLTIRVKAKLLDMQDGQAPSDLFQKVVVNGEES